MKKIHLLLLIILPVFFAGAAAAQAVADTPIEHYVVYEQPKIEKMYTITGRIIGVNLETVQGGTVTNMCTGERTKTDNQGIYRISASKNDSLAFEFPKYSSGLRSIKSPNENLNIIMIKRKADNLPPGYSQSDYKKAVKDDNELYRVLEKDAKLEGRWKY
jgi:hypothetical protein